jgi:hypothetical protein
MPQLTLRAPYRIVLAVSGLPAIGGARHIPEPSAAQGVLASRINPGPGPAFSTTPRSIYP